MFDVYHNYWEGTISANTTWSGTVYVGADVTVNNGVTLTISPGTTVKFASGKKLTINGKLVANSTDPAQRITFTGTTATPGFWSGIKINSGSSTNVSTLRRCDVQYATDGISITYTGNIDTVMVEKCRISNNSSNGIFVYGLSTATVHPRISNNHVHNNGQSGIRVLNYAKPRIYYNRIEDNSSYGLYASGSASAKVDSNYFSGNVPYGMGFLANSLAQVHRNTVTDNGNNGGIYISSSSNVTAYGAGNSKGRNYIFANIGDGIFSISSSPIFGKDLANQYGNNHIQLNTGYQAKQVTSGQLKAERCWWAGQQSDISGNVDLTPYLSTAPLPPVGWGQSGTYDPSTRPIPNPGLIADEDFQDGFFSNATIQLSNSVERDFEPVAWSAEFEAAMKTGFATGDWAEAARVITELWRELQDARVPTVDYVLLAGYAEQREVDSSIRKYLTLTLVEKSLAVQDIATALNELTQYRQSNPDHDAELLANIGIINLHFKNDLVAAENVLSQLQARAAQNDAAAAEQERILAEMIDNYHQNFGGATTAENNRSAKTQMVTVDVSLQVDNFPNPFNPETLIRYQVPGENAQEASLIVYNTLGQKVRTLVADRKNPGEYSVHWDGRDHVGKEAASGMYFLRATIGAKTLTRKLMLVR